MKRTSATTSTLFNTLEMFHIQAFATNKNKSQTGDVARIGFAGRLSSA